MVAECFGRDAHRFRADPEEGEVPYERAKAFGDIVEADNIFPSVESRGMGGELCALVVRDRFSGVSFAYLQSSRDEDSNCESLKHAAGYPLSGRTDTIFCSDTAQELTNAAFKVVLGFGPECPKSLATQCTSCEDTQGIEQTIAHPSWLPQETLDFDVGLRFQGQIVFLTCSDCQP